MTIVAEQRPRVLAIDDVPANLVTLGVVLDAEVDLQVATSGAQGIALALESPPDLILLDVMMPGMDGYEACARLKADPLTRDIPVIFITAQNSPADETRALDGGAVDFISKPINPAVLRARVRTHLTVKQQADLLRSMAFVDGMTGIPNRRQFDETLARDWRSCLRSASPLTVLMIDIDHFKQFNDSYGHPAGDACLKQIAAALQPGGGRPRDLVARYGGEEFVLLLPSTDLAGGQLKAEGVRSAVQDLAIAHRASSVAAVVTVSIGIATVVPTPELTPERLVAAADAQLYAAKLRGRNRSHAIDFGERGA
jgi:diguanylate cyclase (GGDEF)-like protein